MGAGSGYSRLCFNGAQSKSLGWYEEDSVHIVPSLGHAFHGALVGVADWSSKNYEPGEHHIVLTISELRSKRRLHLVYNRAKGPNRDAWRFAGDKVTVTSDTGNGSKSLHEAALGGGEIFRVESFDGGSRDLIIEVVGMSELYPPGGEPDIAHVQVYLEGQDMPAFSTTPGNYSDFVSSHMAQHMLESMDF